MIEESNSLLSSPAGWDTLGYPLFGLYGHQKCQRTWLPTTGSPLAPSWLHSLWRQSADNQEKHGFWKSLWKLYKQWLFLSSMMCFFFTLLSEKNAKMILWFQSFFKGQQFSRQAVKFHESGFGKAHWQCWRYPRISDQYSHVKMSKYVLPGGFIVSNSHHGERKLQSVQWLWFEKTSKI